MMSPVYYLTPVVSLSLACNTLLSKQGPIKFIQTNLYIYCISTYMLASHSLSRS